MNFARYRPFVVGLLKVHRARGLRLAIGTGTIGSSKESVALSAKCYKRENIGPVYPSKLLRGVLKASGASEYGQTVAGHRPGKSLRPRNVSFNEQGGTTYGLYQSAINAQPACVKTLYADRWELHTRTSLFGQTAPPELRTLHGRRTLVFDKRT